MASVPRGWKLIRAWLVIHYALMLLHLDRFQHDISRIHIASVGHLLGPSRWFGLDSQVPTHESDGARAAIRRMHPLRRGEHYGIDEEFGVIG